MENRLITKYHSSNTTNNINKQNELQKIDDKNGKRFLLIILIAFLIITGLALIGIWTTHLYYLLQNHIH